LPFLGACAGEGSMAERVLVEATLTETLTSFEPLVAGAIYGSWAKDELHAASDIDLLLLAASTIRWAHVRTALDHLVDLAGREIHFAGYETRDFWGRGISPYGFLARVLSGPMVPLFGDVRAWHPPFRSKDHVPRVARDRGVKYGGRHRGIRYPG
jgi:predicted nucleotidyltransferase